MELHKTKEGEASRTRREVEFAAGRRAGGHTALVLEVGCGGARAVRLERFARRRLQSRLLERVGVERRASRVQHEALSRAGRTLSESNRIESK